jgi:hypothetical protein
MGIWKFAIGLVVNDMQQRQFFSAGMEKRSTSKISTMMMVVLAGAMILLATRIVWPWCATTMALWI